MTSSLLFHEIKGKNPTELSQADSHAEKKKKKKPFVQYAILNGQLGEENVKYAVGNLSSFRLGCLIHQTLI